MIKPSVSRRITAFFLDWLVATVSLAAFLIAAAALYSSSNAILNLFGLLSSLLGVIAWAAYLLLRDGLFEGASLGKKLMKMQVLRSDGRPCDLCRSVLRNVVLLMPPIVFLEPVLLAVDGMGKRLGDRIAKTQVTVRIP